MLDDDDPTVHKTLDDFKAKYGTTVNYSEVINDNEEFFGTIRPPLEGGQDTGWDLMVLTDWMAARLIGRDAIAIEDHWRWFYERSTPFGHPGAEMRALAAVDLALWDLLGQVTGQPVYRLLGGPVRDRIPVYNTCGGPGYGAVVAEAVPLGTRLRYTLDRDATAARRSSHR